MTTRATTTNSKGTDSPWYMHRDKQRARKYARNVKACEASGEVGAWGKWQDFIDQWPLDTPERVSLVEAFGTELDMLDDEANLYDPSMADIW